MKVDCGLGLEGAFIWILLKGKGSACLLGSDRMECHQSWASTLKVDGVLIDEVDGSSLLEANQ